MSGHNKHGGDADLGEDTILLPDIIHEPYKLVQSLSLDVFNKRAESLGFDARWSCGSTRLPWRAGPSYSNCPHYCTITTTTKMKIMSNDHCGSRPSDNFIVEYNELDYLGDVIDTRSPLVLKYLISPDQMAVMVLFKATDPLNHVGVIFDVSNNIVGYYMVNNSAQFQARFVRQFLLGESRDTVCLVVERQYCDRNSFTRQTFELWSFQRKQQDGTKFEMLNVHNSIEAALRFHGPVFASVPRHDVDLYCVAFFKDSYRLKNLYGTYFIALVDVVKNRYLRVVGSDNSGLQGLNASLSEVHFHHMEPSPCGTYLGLSMERMPGFQMQVLLMATSTLRLLHTIQVPLFIGAGEGFLTASCCANARVTFSKCSTRICLFYQQQAGIGEAHTPPSVQIYQLPVFISLTNICKFQLLRSLSKATIARLPLPKALRNFVLGVTCVPAEDEYMETNSGLRIV